MNRNLHFEKLTLNDDIDIGVYEEALDFAFTSSDIKNIAISGAYGAGKSSVLASYKKKHQNLKFLHISLAHFKDEQDEKIDDGTNASVLEGKILNQLIHQILPANIPQTNFKIKHHIAPWEVVKTTCYCLLALVCVMLILFHNVWSEFVSEFSGGIKAILSISLSPYTRLMAGLLVLVLLYRLTAWIIDLQKNKKLLKRVNVQGTEIEIFEDMDESCFDKYLNEVLYLFENANVDAIVFEDMDRFEMNRIFERLREVNVLVNAQLEKRGKMQLRFIYLLRDDIFVSKDRTKFFDFIVPIVPVLDGTNSYDQFIAHLRKNDMYSKLNGKFLQGLSLYVDDMRLLKNICNEFLIYYNRVNTTELDYDKMFALITYKNLFPRDFSDLQLGKGFIFALFNQRQQFIKKEVEGIETLIREKQEEIESFVSETLVSIEELDIIKMDKQNKISSSGGQLRLQRQREYDAWIESEYPKRKRIIESRSSILLEDLKKELEDLRYKLHKIQTASLKELITRENEDEIFKLCTVSEIGKTEEYIEIKGSTYFPLLKYLVRNGYIDETYADYLTYFYENSVSIGDKIFLRSIADKKAKEEDYVLKDPKLVVSRLDVSDFEEKETLNFNLFKYLLDEMPDSQQLAQLINQIKENHNLEFVKRFLDYFPRWDCFVTRLNNLWPSLFKEIVESNLFEQRRVHDYSLYTLYHSTEEELTNINLDNCLVDYITNSSTYLDIDEPNISKIIEVFKFLGIKFIAIDYVRSNKELFRAVYEQSLYELNFDNIALMLSTMEHVDSEERIHNQNYSVIAEHKESPLFEYIDNHIEAYMVEMMKNCGDRIEDTCIAALEIINNENISRETKIMYIELLGTIIEKVEEIEDTSLWDVCFDCSIISFTESNIVSYYCLKRAFTKALINYINVFPGNIDMRRAEIHDDGIQSEIFVNCLQCYDLENDKYKQILQSMRRVYKNDFPIENVPIEKMSILIDIDIIHMTEKSLATMREKYPDVCDYFVQKNFDTYVDIMKAELLLFEELLRILEWDVLDEKKIYLLGFTTRRISALNEAYSVSVKMHILNNNLEVSDLRVLRHDYHFQHDEIKEFVLKDALENVDQIVEEAADVSHSLFEAILASGQLEDDVELSLIMEMIPFLSREECMNAFILSGRSDFASIFEPRKKPKFVACEENEDVLIKLKDQGWIYEYYYDANDDKHFRIRRHKPQQKLKTELL